MNRYQHYLSVATEVLKHRSYYQSILDLFEYDMWQTLPSDGRAFRGDVAAYISEESGKLLRASAVQEAAEYFRALARSDYQTPLDFSVGRRLVRICNRAERVPAELEAEFIKCGLKNQMIWRDARAAADFDMYKPHMKRLFELKRQIAQALDPDHAPFQVMIDMFDEGLDLDLVCRLFDELKIAIPGILDRVDPQFTQNPIPQELLQPQDPLRMQRVADDIMKKTGFLSSRSNYGSVLHPICYCIGPQDVRVTINYESGIWPLLFTYLHECGHGRYNYSSAPEVVDVGMWGGIDGAMHEGVARFYENMIGKTREFIAFAYPFVTGEFPELKEFSEEEVYNAINHVQPGLKRINTDEVSYSLHPIIRFEMEKDYFEGKIKIEDFREIWNEKYHSYLGQVPQNDREGVLQDISWASGYLGYFQSYTLGNLYGAQLREKLLNDVPNVYANIVAGNFEPLESWMQDNVFRYGKTCTASEAINRITGKGLGTKEFLSYLDCKYCK